MKTTSRDEEIITEQTDYQSDLNKIFDKALKDMDSELMESLDFVSKLNFDKTQIFHVTNSQSGTT